MTSLIAALRGFPVTFVIFALQAYFAVLLGVPLTLEAGKRMVGPWDATARAAALDALFAARPLVDLVSVSALLIGFSWLALSPWLHMAWLSSLSALHGPGRALARGARLFPRALFITVLVALGTALCASPIAALAWASHRAFDPEVNARAHDIALACCLAPLLVVLFAGHTWHDLARARGLERSALRSVLMSAPDAIRPLVLLRAGAWSALGVALVAAAEMIASSSARVTLGSRALLIVLVQGAVLGRMFLRSLWLADALACADADAEPRRISRSST